MSHRSRTLGRLAAVSASRGALLSTSAAARRKGIDAVAATASRSMYEAHKRDVMPPPGWDPTLVDRVPGAKFLGLIAGDENSYFLRSFDALGLSEAEVNAPPAPVTKRFDALMRKAAGSGKLHEMLAVLVVAEWSYLTWGGAAEPVAGLSWLHLEWIDLHRGDYFASVIAYLRGQLDKLELTSAQRGEARAAFLEAVACEKAFWEMARNGDGGGEL